MIILENLKPLIFDTHAHYDDKVFSANLDDLIFSLKQSGVGGIITCGINKETSFKAIELAERYDIVYAAVGIHPENVEDGDKISDIKLLLNHEKCVAVGEIGLDYYWNKENKPKQEEFFKAQLQLAKEYDLPVLVHDREAHGDTLEILKQYKPKGVVHAFSGSVEMSEEILNLGMYLGIGGVLTFKNAKALPSVAKNAPLDRILLETDAPYLAPEPFRGKTNHSAFIKYTAEKLAEIKQIPLNEVLTATFKNAQNLFKI